MKTLTKEQKEYILNRLSENYNLQISNLNVFDSDDINMGNFSILIPTSPYMDNPHIILYDFEKRDAVYVFKIDFKYNDFDFVYEYNNEYGKILTHWAESKNIFGIKNRFYFCKYWSLFNPHHKLMDKIERKCYEKWYKKKYNDKNIPREILSYKQLYHFFPNSNIDFENLSYQEFREFISKHKITYFLDTIEKSGILKDIKDLNKVKEIEDELGITSEKEHFKLI